jgi:H+-transporting ATPase
VTGRFSFDEHWMAMTQRERSWRGMRIFPLNSARRSKIREKTPASGATVGRPNVDSPNPSSPAPTASSGLSSEQAARIRAEIGPNAMEDAAEHPWRRVLHHFWSPVPWMLEVAVVLELATGERVEAAMILALLLFNVVLGTVQESRANATLDLLKQRLAPRARVKRDGAWADVAAADLVPGDLVQLSLGGIVPADMRLSAGSVLVDQSMLTGESVAIEAGAGALTYAGALIRRGEATGEVTATGKRTYFGRTAELVRAAKVESSEQKAVIGVVEALTVVNAVIVVGIVLYALYLHMNVEQIVTMVLTALLSAVPVALPATFTLASALGARLLAMQGVLLTRLTALHEASMIDVLCVDKTGTLTENSLKVAHVLPLADGLSEAAVLRFAAAASSPDGQDPVDSAVRAAAGGAGGLQVLKFVPFDPANKRAEADVRDEAGQAIRVVKGAPVSVKAIAAMSDAAEAALSRYTAEGDRTLAVATGQEGAMQVVGLIAFADPPRGDSAPLLAELKSLGVATVMATGDAPATAETVAKAIGLEGAICPPGAIPDKAAPGDYAVYAGVFPEDKYRLVQAFQHTDHVVGMCGDGANDAPALRQAQMGIAVSTATDVAKSAAGIVLTDPGLGGIVACIREGRSSFQRVLTYTLSILVNKCATLVVMGAGLVMTGHAVLTPLLQALSMLTADMVTMARAADHARPSDYPNRWRVRNLTVAAVPLGLFKLIYCMGLLATAWFAIGLSPAQMQTFTFLALMMAAQCNTYVLREHRHFWRSHPAWVMVCASLAALAFITLLASFGVLMAALPMQVVGGLYVATLAYAFALDAIKVAVFRRIQID